MAGITYETACAGAQWFDKKSSYNRLRARWASAPHRVCHVMAQAIIDANLVPTSGSVSRWAGFPWLTPVLGSGCLQVGTSKMLSRDRVSERVHAELQDVLTKTQKHLGGGLDQPKLAAGFAAALVEDRFLPEGGGVCEGRYESVGVDQLSARVALLASLVTRLFLLSKAYGRTPLQRFEQDEDQLGLPCIEDEDEGDNKRKGKVESEELKNLRDLCISHLDAARDNLGILEEDVEAGVRSAMDSLLVQIREDLNAARTHLSIGKLRLLTEVAWYLIARGTAIYPGWTDVLVRLALNDDEPDQATARPCFRDVRYLGSKVEALLRGATEKSWESWTKDFGEGRVELPPGVERGTERQQLYSAVADVLWAQSEARRDAREADGQSKLPVASAFVVSFDMELEMALWFGPEKGRWFGEEDRPFYVLTPVQVLTDANDQRAQLCWLRGRYRRATDAPTLTPEAVLERYLRRPEAWELVRWGMEDLDGPHVVRMSGCPMLRLPEWSNEVDQELLTEIWKSLGSGGDSCGPERIKVIHAVTIDEYLARQHFETELAWALSKGRPNLALPDLVLRSAHGMDEGENPRFWMTLGVPVSDTAVRERLVTQMTLGGIPSKAQSESSGGEGGDGRGSKAAPVKGWGVESAEQGIRPDTALEGEQTGGSGAGLGKRLAGVVVNSSITKEEAGILCWLGLDVVHDTAQKFVGELRHYARHLEPEKRPLRMSNVGQCVLDTGGQ